LGEQIDPNLLVNEIIERSGDGKVKFGFSWYGGKANRKIGMDVKGRLKEKGINSRLVTSKDKTLSAVVVTKNKCLDFVVVAGAVGLTQVVFDFKEYGKVDYGRPAHDSVSGMLPPKAAKMMINLAEAKTDAVLLDPFCGSGTVLMEAALMGYQNLIGSDVSAKAAIDTETNMNWLVENYKLDIKKDIFKSDVRKLDIEDGSVDAIVSEPYLGPPVRGELTSSQLREIIKEVSDIYLGAFKKFSKIVKSGGRLVIIFPQWHQRGELIGQIDLRAEIKELEFNRKDKANLIYKRDDQKVWREITIWEKD